MLNNNIEHNDPQHSKSKCNIKNFFTVMLFYYAKCFYTSYHHALIQSVIMQVVIMLSNYIEHNAAQHSRSKCHILDDFIVLSVIMLNVLAPPSQYL